MNTALTETPLTCDVGDPVRPSVHALVDAVAQVNQVPFAVALEWLLSADWSVVAGELVE